MRLAFDPLSRYGRDRHLTQRLLFGCFAVLLAGVALSWAHNQREPQWRIAQGMAGQHWYRLGLETAHIGYLASQTRPGSNGGWIFSSDLRFAMSESAPVQIQQTLSFGPSAPYPLLRADYSLRRGSNQLLVNAVAKDGQTGNYQVQLSRNGTESSEITQWSYTLGDYLAFETWLQDTKPGPGSRLTIRSLDLERLRLTPKVMQLEDQSEAGYRVSNSAPQSDSSIELQPNFVPKRMQLAGLFELEQSTQAQALAPRSALQHASYFVSLDKPLRNHSELTQLQLEPQPSSDNSWPSPLILNSNSISSSAEPAAHDLQATADYPIHDARLQTLLGSLDLADDAQQNTERLTRFVHNFLTYKNQINSTPVLDLLDRPQGDCSEYAELFTSLARAAGIPSRTVYGLAYTDEPSPALSFHAWNEAWINDHWLSVDPTWNQVSVDATHLLLPTNERAALRLLTGRSEVSFNVLATQYSHQYSHQIPDS